MVSSKRKINSGASSADLLKSSSVSLSPLQYSALWLLATLASPSRTTVSSFEEDCWILPGLFLSTPRPETLQAGSRGLCRTHLICFPSLRDYCPLLPAVQCPEIIVSYILFSFLVSWEGRIKSGPCHSILTRSSKTTQKEQAEQSSDLTQGWEQLVFPTARAETSWDLGHQGESLDGDCLSSGARFSPSIKAAMTPLTKLKKIKPFPNKLTASLFRNF